VKETGHAQPCHSSNTIIRGSRAMEAVTFLNTLGMTGGIEMGHREIRAGTWVGPQGKCKILPKGYKERYRKP